ncbi:TIR domain-containing protein [Phenylobacterium sp.]|uniref:TIR domain-containing protein n=1 Tax=Phenylobacterium sp. TaxID=1871053 RepID=UPI0025D2AE20|nr:TIR domain-containing protein [Phenylobacterium sp.]
MTGSAADIFVSYKSHDRPRIRRLVDALEAEGFSVWWDAHISGGANWHQKIEANLDSARCVIVAWTSASVGPEGQFVRDEARRAQERNVYLPIRLDTVRPPLGFGEIQALSLLGWNGDRSDPGFQAIADAVRGQISGEPVVRPHPPVRVRRVSRRALVAGGAGVAAAAVAGVGAWALLKPSAAAAPKSIAVLPFANLSGDPDQAYFSEGMADEIRSALARLGGLTVIGATSSIAVRNEDARTVARKLGVSSILTGSVRQSPSTIRVSAELIDGRTGAYRWTQQYDRQPGDAIRIQTDIAQNVATALKGALGLAAQAAITLGGTADRVAQDLVLQIRKLGREFTSLESIRRRIALADAAISRDPNYAEAFVQKADALNVLAANFASSPTEIADLLAQADATVEKAVALAPRLGSAHAILASVALTTLDFPRALQETRRSLALSPSDPEVLTLGACILGLLARSEEALRIADQAIALDPLNARCHRYKAQVLIRLGRYAQAIEAGRKSLQISPEGRSAHILLGDALLGLGRIEQAKSEYRAAGPGDSFILLRRGLLTAQSHDRAGAERMLGQLKAQFGATASYQYAQIRAALGDKDLAFAELENALRAKDPGLAELKVDPFLDPIRSDPRYAALLTRLNFP